MQDENALIARLESADTDDLMQLILNASVEEERALRTYLGNACYQRMRSLTLRRGMRGAGSRGNVVVIPGILGSELSSIDSTGEQERIWLSPRRIVEGQFVRLQLDKEGLHELDPNYTVSATGIMKRYYGELMLTLAQNWHVHAFWYDWRKDMKLAATQLLARINTWFGEHATVNIVAHSVGGLVARTYIKQYKSRWSPRSRLVMLGTPNRGLFLTLQGITGHLDLIRWIDELDGHHDEAQIRATVLSFPGFYQLLPSPFPYGPADPPTEVAVRQFAALYKPETYGLKSAESAEYKALQAHLTNAHDHHKALLEVVDPKSMICVAGYNQPTWANIKPDALQTLDFTDIARIKDQYKPDEMFKSYRLGSDGDGSVPCEWGQLRDPKTGVPVPSFYVEARHGELPLNPKVLTALDDLLGARIDSARWQQIEASSGLLPQAGYAERRPSSQTCEDMEAEVTSGWDADRQQLRTLARRVHPRSGEPIDRPYFTAEERAIEEILTRNFAASRQTIGSQMISKAAFRQPNIEIRLVAGDITDPRVLDRFDGAAHHVDAIAVGHYSGGMPHGAIRDLDKQLVAEGHAPAEDDDDQLQDSGSLLTQCALRGAIRGDLGVPFFIDDPRQPGRLIFVAGMGLPGRFGAPELSVLARELCWMAGRLGKKHLATVLIGTGRENLPVGVAISAWIRGLKNALTGATQKYSLARLTFVIRNPQKLAAANTALCKEVHNNEAKCRMKIDYAPLAAEPAPRAIPGESEERPAQASASVEARQDDTAPTRVTVAFENGTYRFGAITSTASIPERVIPLDPNLVWQANDELAAEGDPEHQIQLGQFMECLLIPADLRDEFTTSAPLVMMLDPSTARIHWELLAQPDMTYLRAPGQHTTGSRERRDYFLGTSRGFTRQLRTGLAPLPEPPPPPKRLLRVLIVADPARDAHLPGAEEEGILVADLFERFNIVYARTKNRIEVVRLFGPYEATRTAVMRELMLRTYDVLHFAGHCMYDNSNPNASGWIFSNGERLSAREFTRIDRVPKFVFSNACESGITPDRSDLRSVDLAPSLAEAFFQRGVSNFVCTAWPVDDRAAREFALTLYANLLGLQIENPVPASGADDTQEIDATDINRYSRAELQPIYAAMQVARCTIAEPPNDIRTWGAYQHYGNPYFRLFDPAGMNVTQKSLVRKDMPAPTSDVPAVVATAQVEVCVGTTAQQPVAAPKDDLLSRAVP